MRVYYEDTDASGIVYYANYLKFAERGRTEMMRELGFAHSRIFAETGVAFTVRRLSADYRQPARLDDALIVETRVVEVGAATLASVAWAVSVVLLRAPLQEVEPTTAQAIRLPIAAALLWVTPWARGTVGTLRASGRRARARVAVLSALTALSSVMFVASVKYAGVTVAAVLSSTAPLFAVPLGILFLKERLSAAAIAGASRRVEALVLGHADFCKDLGVRQPRATEGILLHVRCTLVLAARAAGVEAIDTIYESIGDLEGLRAEAEQAAALGFTGKLALHPGQVEPIQAAFTPTPGEVAYARRVVEGFDAAKAAGRGVFTLDGRMIDEPFVEVERRLLARARQAGVA